MRARCKDMKIDCNRERQETKRTESHYLLTSTLNHYCWVFPAPYMAEKAPLLTHRRRSDRAFVRSAAVNMRIEFQSAKRRRNISLLKDAKGREETHGLPSSTWTPMDWNLVVGVCSSFRNGCTQSTCGKKSNIQRDTTPMFSYNFELRMSQTGCFLLVSTFINQTSERFIQN